MYLPENFSRNSLLISVLLGCLAAQASRALPVEHSTSRSRPSMRVVTEGDPDATQPAFCASLDTLLKYPHSVLPKLTATNDNSGKAVGVSMHEVGKANFRRIVEVRYIVPEDEQSDIFLATYTTYIDLESEGFCALVAVQQRFSKGELEGERNTTSRILNMSGQPILESIVRVPGTGHFQHQHYFFFDTDQPLSVDLSNQAGMLAAPYIPRDATVRKGGSFSLEPLQWRSGLWRAEDANCCPTGGELFIQYRLNGHSLEVMEYEIFPNYEALLEAKGTLERRR